MTNIELSAVSIIVVLLIIICILLCKQRKVPSEKITTASVETSKPKEKGKSRKKTDPESLEPEKDSTYYRRHLVCSEYKRFFELFRFKPEFIEEDRHRKDMLMALSFLAIELKKQSAKVKQDICIYEDLYLHYSQNYSEMLELIGYFDPVFQRQIPHWTELPQFVERWLQGGTFEDCKKTKSNTVTVET